MSVSAVHPDISLERPDCAARLIPGGRSPHAAARKRPQVTWPDGRIRVAQSKPEIQAPGLMDFVLPNPLTVDRWILLSAVLADYVMILAGWGLASAIEGVLRLGLLHGAISAPRYAFERGYSAVCFAVITTLLGYSEGLYFSAHVHRRSHQMILAKAIGWATLLQALILRMPGQQTPSISCIAGSALLSYGGLVGWRRWQRASSRRRAGGAKRKHNVLIVGAGTSGRQVADYLAEHPELGRVVVGFLDDDPVSAFGVLGPPERLVTIARERFADEVILATPLRDDLTRQLIREGRKNHLDVRAVPDLHGCEPHHPWIESLGEIPVVTLHREPLPSAELFLKRVLDVALSACALVMVAPLMLVIAAIIRIDSKGSVIYSAQRVGRKGQRFRCHKFRTMVTNAGELKERLRVRNQREGPCFKIADDPRITRVGRWLRRYSLDELPQLWNVLKGEMSLVGPRPHPLDDFARYALEHLRRLDVTPGITGLWQVTERRNPSFERNLALDLEYIECWSLWMDLRILFRTIAVVFQGTGA